MFISPEIRPNFFKKALLFSSFFIFASSWAKEGLWIPATLKDRENDLKVCGCQIPIEKLYNTDGTGLNNAVVLFGSGCTAEVISPRGLLLTNHHCGYGTVQGLSSVKNDYFANGFWAKNNAQEIPCPGLSVTFIRKMENVTDKVLYYLPDTLQGKTRDSIIALRVAEVEQSYKKASGMDATIKPYYAGNQYWVTLTETYKDVRLVGFPPDGIGKFGGDTDNWSWPRHTGDFSMFRVYAGKNNKPAPYSKQNRPYRTKQFFPINTSGYKEGDFTMVYGFPGTTMEYISSYQLKQYYEISDPIRIETRTVKLGIWKKNMETSRDLYIKYTSKYAGIANGWKKWQGEVLGLSTNNVMGKKQAHENDYQQWASDNAAKPYAGVLLQMEAAANAVNSKLRTDEYIKEAVLGVELIQQGATLDKMLQCFRSKLTDSQLQDTLKILCNAGFYKNYDAENDKQVFKALMPLYFENSEDVPSYYAAKYKAYNRNFGTWAEELYRRSIATGLDKMEAFAATAHKEDTVTILKDPAWKLYTTVTEYRTKRILPALARYSSKMATLNRLYMKGQMEQRPNFPFYPDANLTLRLTYGHVKGIDPEGPAKYSYQTTLDEAIAKDNPEIAEFKVPQKLKELYEKKDYGRWAVNGTVPLAFVADNHTSGGNSGSPVLNAKGQLIGTNFDRVWEGTMSDFNFDPSVCRNISLDIRYTLFIIQKFGGAGWLLNEMKLVKN